MTLPSTSREIDKGGNDWVRCRKWIDSYLGEAIDHMDWTTLDEQTLASVTWPHKDGVKQEEVRSC